MALTPEQVENWRKVLRGAIGPYASIMPEEQIQELVARMQSQLTPVAADAAIRRCPECRAMLEVNSVYCDRCGTDTPRR